MVYLRCSKVVAKVSDIVDRKANLLVRVRFHAHIMMCDNCRRYFHQFLCVKERIGNVTSDDLPDDFDNVMNFVMTEITQQNDKKNV